MVTPGLSALRRRCIPSQCEKAIRFPSRRFDRLSAIPERRSHAQVNSGRRPCRGTGLHGAGTTTTDGRSSAHRQHGSIYADLVVALRDVDGVPIPARFPVLQDDLSVLDQECVQPISYAPLPLITTTTPNPVDGRDVYLIPLMGETLGDGEVADPAVISVCDPQPNWAMYVSEAALERLNLARTDDKVLESKLAGTEIRLTTADEIALDGAGRITTDGVAIDASPDQAAIYWSLMRTGTIPGLVTSPAKIVVPVASSTPGIWQPLPSAPRRARACRSRSTRSSTTTASKVRSTTPTPTPRS